MPSGERSVKGLVLMIIVPDPQQTSSDSSQIFPQTEKRVSCSANTEDPDHRLITKLLSSGLIYLYPNLLHSFFKGGPVQVSRTSQNKTSLCLH